MNYSNSATFKTYLSRSNTAAVGVTASVGLYRSTSVINRVDIFSNSGTFNSGSTFSLYGIAVGNPSAKAQGGHIVTTDGTYFYHAFTASGSFIPNEALTADILVVAGGGGGGDNTVVVLVDIDYLHLNL